MLVMVDCYYDNNDCQICPEQQTKPAVPGHITYNVDHGWDAGANSVQELDGDLRLILNPDFIALGAMIGFRTGRADVTNIARIEHGVYVQTATGVVGVSVVERGRTVTPAKAMQKTDVIEVRRENGTVTVRVNDVVWYMSATRSVGPKVVGGCLYSSGDQLPRGGAAA